jgi:hypothetical protein
LKPNDPPGKPARFGNVKARGLFVRNTERSAGRAGGIWEREEPFGRARAAEAAATAASTQSEPDDPLRSMNKTGVVARWFRQESAMP